MRRALAAFTAASLLGGTAATLALAPLPAARAQYAPPEDAEAQAERRLAFERADGPMLSVQLDPAFEGLATVRRTCPLVVRVKNRGSATNAQIEYDAAGDDGAGRRTYTRRVQLPGGGAVSQFVIYPSTARDTYRGYGDTFSVRVRTPLRTVGEVISFPYFGDRDQVGYIGDRVGALNLHSAERAWRDSEEARRLERDGAPPSVEYQMYSPFTPCHAKPEDAPDRAVGYSSLNHLVLGEGAERLSEAQWSAIREWVKGGGSLLLLDGRSGHRYSVRGAELLSPVAVPPATAPPLSWHTGPDGTGRLDLDGLRLPPDGFKVSLAVPVEGATRLGDGFSLDGRRFAAFARRDLGMGTVLYVGFDPTREPFREWPHLNQLWRGLLKRATPPVPAASVTELAADTSDQLTGGFPVPNTQGQTAASDPFSVQMPHLRTVVYLFLGYFVLVVPVTFVVLKRTRRMNLAWVTGPTLAVGVAGALYLFTTDLYRAPSSRRTAGVLIAANGEADARFAGYTELFFSRAGRYDVTVPGAERVELTPNLSRYGYYDNHHHDAASAAIRTLETREEAASVGAATLPVSNLAFRRLYHEQAVALGGAIEVKADCNQDGTLSYSVRNGTRRHLREARLVLPAGMHKGRWFDNRSLLLGDRLTPGATVSGKLKPLVAEYTPPSYPGSPTALHVLQQRVEEGRTALFLARTDGSDLGPNAGRYAGGDRSVLVAVAVPNPTAKGGR